MIIIGLIEHIEDEEEGVTKDSKDHMGCHVEDYKEVPKDPEATEEATDREAVIKEATKTIKKKYYVYDQTGY